jgi:hypothetical protein
VAGQKAARHFFPMLLVFISCTAADSFPSLLTGIPKSLSQNYTAAIHQDSQTFSCLDNSKVIPLSKFNDNYRDCPDGSDEPGTSDGPSFDFYCENTFYNPLTIRRWSVGDGLCDCCDGSDERFTRGANCPNTCSAKSGEHAALLQRLTSKYEEGLLKLASLREEGIAHIENSTRALPRCIRDLRILKRQLEGVQKSPAYATADGEVAPFPKWRGLLLWLWQKTFLLSDDEQPFLIESVSEEERSKRADAVQQRIWAIESERDRAKVIVEGKFPPEWVLSYEESHTIGGNEVLLLKEVKRNGYPSGKYRNATAEKMVFDDGGYCWEAKRSRSTTVKLVCWPENRMVAFSEPHVCQYEAVLACPAGCSRERIGELASKTLEELERIAVDLNFV